MRLAIMQPYLFPYIGYYQLVAAVERFVFYDDVAFIKNGWINRNRLLLSGQIGYFTVPLVGASSFREIREVEIQPSDRWRRKILESIRQSYARAPNFAEIFALFLGVLETPTNRIADLAKKSVVSVAEYLGFTTEFIWTSAAYSNRHLSGTDRVLDICRKEHATEYLNLPGGRALYCPATFAAAGVTLHFVQAPTEKKALAVFRPTLSILDLIMWNSRTAVMSLFDEGRRPV